MNNHWATTYGRPRCYANSANMNHFRGNLNLDWFSLTPRPCMKDLNFRSWHGNEGELNMCVHLCRWWTWLGLCWMLLEGNSEAGVSRIPSLSIFLNPPTPTPPWGSVLVWGEPRWEWRYVCWVRCHCQVLAWLVNFSVAIHSVRAISDNGDSRNFWGVG